MLGSQNALAIETSRRLAGLLVVDFPAQVLSAVLENDSETPLLQPVTAPHAQVKNVLADVHRSGWHSQLDFALVWTLPELAVPLFSRAIQGQAVGLDTLLAEVDTFARAVADAAQGIKWLFVPAWTLSPAVQGSILGAWRPGGGLTHLLTRMNARLAESLADCTNVFMLDPQPWILAAGREAFSEQLWFQGKIPFVHSVFQAAIRDIKAALRGLQGQSSKLVVVNLDDTLWGGRVGEVGWEGLQVGGEDPAGQAYEAFQEALKWLKQSGVALAIVSNNDEGEALDALRRHPRMTLRPEDFAGWRINWDDPAKNVAELAAGLQLGLASVVFIDEDPVTRTRIREALPAVLVPEWPDNPLLFKRSLLALKCFEHPRLGAEARARAQAAEAERCRAESRRPIPKAEESLRHLDLRVKVEKLSPANLARAVQLINQSRQMNLATRQPTPELLSAWAGEPGHSVWLFRVSHKLSDEGIAGVASLETSGTSARIVDFALSSRVLGRRIEEAMLHWLVQQAQHSGARALSATCQTTPQNQPGRDFWRRSAFHPDETGAYCWNTGINYPLPDFIQLTTGYHNGQTTVRRVIETGQTGELRCRLTEETVRQFIALTGDNSPLHADPEFARRCHYGGILAHGLCPVLFLSALELAQQPGRRVMFRKLSARFHHPIYPGDPLVLKARISEYTRELQEVELEFAWQHRDSGQEAATGLATLVMEKTSQDTTILIAPQAGTPLMVVDPLPGAMLMLEQIQRGAMRDFRFQITDASLRACFDILQGAVENLGMDYETWRWRCDATSLLGSSLVSTFVGQCLPGSYGTCRDFDLTFHQPLEKYQPYRFIGKVLQTSPSTASVLSQITIADTQPGSGIALVAGKIEAGVQPPPV